MTVLYFYTHFISSLQVTPDHVFMAKHNRSTKTSVKKMQKHHYYVLLFMVMTIVVLLLDIAHKH